MTPQRTRTLVDVVNGLARCGDDVALLAFHAAEADEPETWTFAQLHAAVRGLSAGLARDGLQPAEPVAIVAPNSPAWVAAAFAVIAAGGVAVPVDSQLDDETLAHILRDSGARRAFTTHAEPDRLERAAGCALRCHVLDDGDGSTASWQTMIVQDAEPPSAGAPGETAAMFYTSGTTGPPKGVPLSHANIAYQLDTLRAMALMTPGARLLLPLPLHHVYPFVVGLLGALVYGVGVVMPRTLTGPEVIAAIRSGHVATVIGVPRLFNALSEGITSRARARGPVARRAFDTMLDASIAARRRLGLRIGRQLFRPVHARFGPDLRLLVSGGAALDPETAWTLTGLGWTVTTGYGLTETAPMVSILSPGDTHFAGNGKVVPGTEVRIAPLPEANDTQPATNVGEIQIRGPGVFAGYHHLPERTAEAFTGDGWFRAGDRGYLNGRGDLHVLGRPETLVVTEAGVNIQIEALEAAYRASLFIADIGILAGERGLAAVVVPNTAELRRFGGDPKDGVRRAVRERGLHLRPHERLTDVVIAREPLARTRLGKIRRQRLRDQYAALHADAAGAGGRGRPVDPAAMSPGDRDLLADGRARAVWDWLASRYADRPLTPESSITLDLGVDSLDWMVLTLEIQQRTGAALSDAATARIESVRDLLREVVAAGAGKATLADPVHHPARHLTAEQLRWLAPLSGPQQIAAWLLYWINRLAMRALFRVRGAGLDNVPRDRPFVLTANHQSVLDPLVIAAALPYGVLRRCAFAGWTGIAFANPVFRWICRLAHVFPIDHEKAAFASMALGAEALRRDMSLIWFPEGARSFDGSLQPFRPGIGALLAVYPRPAVPARIAGTFDAMPRGARLPRPHRLTFHIGKPVEVAEIPASSTGESRAAAIAETLHDAVAHLGDAKPASGGSES
jgi:long-chain acyl-CoA synthetase